jgi:dolichol-phosphate mannosyltransferase
MLPFDKSVIIIPTYNEKENIEKMVSALLGNYQYLSILIIDDGSPDGTANIVKKLQENHPTLHLIERGKKLGLGTAYITGFRWAIQNGFEFVFEMDCDFSHSPDDIPRLLEAAQTADMVIGSRYIDGISIVNWPMKRLLLSYCASIYTRFLTGIPIKDTTGGFKCFRKTALESLNFDKIVSNGYSFQLEVNYKIWAKGLKIKEVPIIFYERRNGQSKMDKSIVFEALFAVFFLRLRKVFGLL